MKSDRHDPCEARPPAEFRKSQLILFLSAAFAFLYLRTFILPGTPLVARGDETLYFTHGIRIAHGQVPFRDYFTFVMPGVDLFYGAAFALLGVHAWLAQTFVILLGTTIAGLLVWTARYVLTGASIYLPGLLFLVLDFDTIKDATHHWYSTLLILAATGVLLGGRSLRRVAICGALCGLATLFTQSQGALSLLALAAWLYWTGDERRQRRSRQLAALLLPFAVIVGGVLAYYAHMAGIATLYAALVTFVFHNFSAFRAHTPRAYFLQVPPHHRLTDLAQIVPYVFVHVLLPFGYLFSLWRLFREQKTMKRRTWESMLLINSVGLALCAAIANAPTYPRMSMVAPPAAIVCVWLVGRTCSVDRRLRGALWTIAMVAMVALPIVMQRHWRGYVDLPTGRTAFLDRDEYEEFSWFAQHTHAGESFFNGTQLSFVLGLENPTTVDYVTVTEYTRPEQVSAAIQGLERHRTPLVVYYAHTYAPTPDLYPPGRMRSNLGPFLEYVARNYHLTKAFPQWQVWERN